MRNSEKIYNTKYNLIQTTSDLCAFNYPQYQVENFDIIQPEVTLESPNVFLIESPIDIPINLTFISNTDQLTDTVKYNYQILSYNHELLKFDSVAVYTSPVYSYTELTHESIVNTQSLLGEGEYLMKVGYQFDACTFIAGLLGKRYVANTFNSLLPFGGYDANNDKYFIVLYRADEPRIDGGATEGGDVDEETGVPLNDILLNRPLAVEDGVDTYTLDLSTSGDVIITLNGMTLQAGPENDYTLVGSILTFSEPLVQSDVVNYIIFGKASSSTLKSESLSVTNFIPEGPTNGEGTHKIYLNSDSNKYEIYTQYRIKNKDSLVITINGATLSNGIDYYVSTSNSKRIILEGDLIVGDVINIVYDSGENLIRTVTQDYIDVSWYVINEIKRNYGEFFIELSTNEFFTDIVQTETIPYEVGVLNYSHRVPLNYSYGQVLYYRIRNVKTYVTLVGSELITENVSDTIRIEIKTNISNNY